MVIGSEGHIKDVNNSFAVGQLWSEVNDNGAEVNGRATIWQIDNGIHLDLHQFVDAKYTRSQANSITVTESSIIVLGTVNVFDERYTLIEKRAVLWRYMLS